MLCYFGTKLVTHILKGTIHLQKARSITSLWKKAVESTPLSIKLLVDFINQPVSVLPLNMCVISYLMTHHFKTAYLKQTVTVAIFT